MWGCHLHELELDPEYLVALVVDIGLEPDALPAAIGRPLQVAADAHHPAPAAQAAGGALVGPHQRFLKHSTKLQISILQYTSYKRQILISEVSNEI